MSGLENLIHPEDFHLLTSSIRHEESGFYVENGGAHSQHVALIQSTKTNRMLSLGVNCLKPVSKNLGGSIHAESIAIQTFLKKMKAQKIKKSDMRHGVKLLSLRFDRSGNLKNAKPCERCSSMIKNCSYITKVVYSDEHANFMTEQRHTFSPGYRSCGDIRHPDYVIEH